MRGPEILRRSIEAGLIRTRDGRSWQYHGRSDRHSKVACWGVVFDLLEHTPLLRRHVVEHRVCFGINHEMRDFAQNRKKDLDLVLATWPVEGQNTPDGMGDDFAGLVEKFGIVLSSEDRRALAALPRFVQASVGSVLCALEAKATMTEHIKALQRLYDELNSSQATIHGSADQAIAIGLSLVNTSTSFVSPAKTDARNNHDQPKATKRTLDKIGELPRRTRAGEFGFDALAVILLDFENDGGPVRLIHDGLAPAPGSVMNYASMINRVSALYATRFAHLSG